MNKKPSGWTVLGVANWFCAGWCFGAWEYDESESRTFNLLMFFWCGLSGWAAIWGVPYWEGKKNAPR